MDKEENKIANGDENIDLLAQFRNLIETAKIKSAGDNSDRKAESVKTHSDLIKKSFRIWNISSDNADNPTSENKIRVGSHVWSGFLSEDEIGLKLGETPRISTSYVLIMDKTQLIHADQVLLLGADIPEIMQNGGFKEQSPKESPPDSAITKDFAWIVLISVTPDYINNLRTLSKLRSTLYFHDEIEGIMRGASIRVHSFSISKQLLTRRISFRDIAVAFNEYVLNIDKQFDFITGIEHIFVVDDKDLINKLIEFGTKLKRNHVLKYKKAYPTFQKLRNDCDFLWDCASCNYKNICDSIRNMIK